MNQLENTLKHWNWAPDSGATPAVCRGDGKGPEDAHLSEKTANRPPLSRFPFLALGKRYDYGISGVTGE